MKRIGKSKEPTLKTLQNITENLKEKFRRSFCLTLESWSYDIGDQRTGYHISILPGIDGSSCTGKPFETWSDLLNYYHKLMKEGLPSE